MNKYRIWRISLSYSFLELKVAKLMLMESNQLLIDLAEHNNAVDMTKTCIVAVDFHLCRSNAVECKRIIYKNVVVIDDFTR